MGKFTIRGVTSKFGFIKKNIYFAANDFTNEYADYDSAVEYGHQLSNNWRMPVEICQRGRAITMLWPTSK